MKKLAAIGMLFFIGMCFSCRQNDGLTQEEEAQNLRVLLSEIEVFATSESCVDASAWTYTSYGEKACGGPVGYIGYATSIDTELFLQKVEAHREAERAFNEKWGIISTCDTPQEPSGVVCENENPVFTYEN